MTDLSIIIVSYNTKSLLRDCLASVQRCSGEADIETIVVDNKSSDDSCIMVAREFPSVGLIRNPVNSGFTGGNNIGIEQSHGRNVMLLNPDTVVQPGTFRTLLDFMDGHTAAGYCGPRLFNADGSDQPSARRFPTPFSAAFSMSGLAERFPQSRHTLELPMNNKTAQPVLADWLSGACLMVRREAIKNVGLLDTGFFMYFEETDWCRRLAKAGWSGWLVPSTGVIHLGGQSVGGRRSTAPFWGNHPVHWLRSRRYYMQKHFGRSGLWLSEGLDVCLNAIIWLHHFWQGSEESRYKTQKASATLRHLLF
jgi:N-acetylglucosaminyl-diphospho-decaprenol L-rhamnosyltransferase